MNKVDIERSIIKTYRKEIKSRFIKAIKEYQLIEDGDKIAIAISGGKDSILMAKLFQLLSRHGIKNFEVRYISMDPGFSKDTRRKIEDLYSFLDIPVEIFETDVFKVAKFMTGGENPCYLCARMRRGALYQKASDLGCNKLALGHHFDDVIETVMLNLLMAGSFKTMMPKLRADNFENMELIRPLYLIREKDIIRFVNFTGLKPIDCACEVEAGKIGSKRNDMKELIKDLSGKYANADINIFRATENVSIDMILGYKDKNGKHLFPGGY
ncbi:MAG: tRNA 2-thiocytidine(32) synthetase TtcA [Tissierellia bacterium]|nr:tRNA 2-thiocytidine(32) synthetase TtcA [Tissierellia bacterium]